MIRFSKIHKLSAGLVLSLVLVGTWLQAQENTPAEKKLTITQAVMCQEIEEYTPQDSAVVFSMAIGRVFCFTSFNPVPRNMVIYHSWYRQDRLITTKRLSLKTPEWSTFSTIQLRQADKGPWRVEIKDDNNQILKIVRFSITD